MISDAMTKLRMRLPLGEGRIERLRAKALDGDLETSRTLHAHYLEEGDAEQEYRYACFRCMQGDMGMVWEMFRSGRMIQTGFPEDDPFREARLRKADASVVNYRRVSPTAFGLEVFGDEYLDLLESKAEEGYPDAVAQMALLDEEGSRRWREAAMDAQLKRGALELCLLSDVAKQEQYGYDRNENALFAARFWRNSIVWYHPKSPPI